MYLYNTDWRLPKEEKYESKVERYRNSAWTLLESMPASCILHSSELVTIPEMEKRTLTSTLHLLCTDTIMLLL